MDLFGGYSNTLQYSCDCERCKAILSSLQGAIGKWKAVWRVVGVQGTCLSQDVGSTCLCDIILAINCPLSGIFHAPVGPWWQLILQWLQVPCRVLTLCWSRCSIAFQDLSSRSEARKRPAAWLSFPTATEDNWIWVQQISCVGQSAQGKSAILPFALYTLSGLSKQKNLRLNYLISIECKPCCCTSLYVNCQTAWKAHYAHFIHHHCPFRSDWACIAVCLFQKGLFSVLSFVRPPVILGDYCALLCSLSWVKLCRRPMWDLPAIHHQSCWCTQGRRVRLMMVGHCTLRANHRVLEYVNNLMCLLWDGAPIMSVS